MATRGQRKTRVGRVVSDKMQKTVVVAVDRIFVHPLYGRRLRRTKKLYAHDAEGIAHIGDTVRVMETRPLSKMKRWRVVEVIARGQSAE